MWKNFILLLILAAFLSSCATKAQTGMGTGAAAGAIAGQAIGRNTGATLIGAAVGALLGYAVGNEMDKADQAKISAAYESMPDGRTTQWVNPNNGNQYAVTPQYTYKNEDNQNCREAEILATVDGRPEKIIQKACRDEYGNWRAQ
ncbi:MAG: glycine zipper 2TM domain-containing protein [Proteobacteria bacterium]|nr:glycine zipper 2TM domain-containing protein [Pseudomonadota bacterium]MBU4298054.1 glycine zipper 2TM domain-containing protein [Pseudomonadota bacterium]MCG2746341.1 glycine zipper domain-containing protein [Desulfobulbaceae bacterium]